jgi:hypothetical protein
MAHRHTDALAECDLEGNVLRIAGGGRVMGRQKEFVLSSVRDAAGRAVLDAQEARRLASGGQGPTPNPHYQPTPAARMAAFRRDVSNVAVAYEQATTGRERARAAAAAGSTTEAIEEQKHELTQALAAAVATAKGEGAAATATVAGAEGRAETGKESSTVAVTPPPHQALPAAAGVRRSRSADSTPVEGATAAVAGLVQSASVGVSSAPKPRRQRGSLLDDVLL